MRTPVLSLDHSIYERSGNRRQWEPNFCSPLFQVCVQRRQYDSRTLTEHNTSFNNSLQQEKNFLREDREKCLRPSYQTTTASWSSSPMGCSWASWRWWWSCWLLFTTALSTAVTTAAAAAQFYALLMEVVVTIWFHSSTSMVPPLQPAAPPNKMADSDDVL